MKAEGRKEVLWLGGSLPQTLEQVLKEEGLELRIVTELQLQEAARSACGIIIEFQGNAEQFLVLVRTVQESLLDHGLAIGLVHSASSDPLDFGRASTAVTSPEQELVRSFYTNWKELAEWLASRNPGPGVNPSLDIERNFAMRSVVRLLLKRAFSDLDKIYVKREEGGYSGATVLRVYSRKPEKILPFLVKIDKKDVIRREILLYEDYVARFLSFNHRPNIDSDRCVEAKDMAVLVQDFVDRALPIRSVLQAGHTSALVASLFDSTLRGWRLTGTKQNGKPWDYFLRRNMVTYNLEALKEAAEYAEDGYGTVLNADQVVQKLGELKGIDYYQCKVHGDLHTGNMFVPAGSTEVVLIDFATVDEGPAAADPACLEVDLALNVFSVGTETLNDDQKIFLRDLYKYPLDLPDTTTRRIGCEWLWESIRAIRMFGYSTDSNPFAYIIAVSCYLLRLARLDKSLSPDKRALSYFIAQDLVSKLWEELKA